MMPLIPPGVQVILVPDDPSEFSPTIPPGVRELVNEHTVVMSNDNLRMYVKEATWKAMQQSHALTAPRA